MFDHLEAKIYILICWIFFIFILIATPIPGTSSNGFTIYDKVVHFFLFGILSFLFGWVLIPWIRKKRVMVTNIAVLVLVSSYILGGEYLQNLVPGREPALGDVLAGLFGMFIGLVLINSYSGKTE